ncbi:MAG: hypothetical protein ACRCYZ_04750 [Alphaproteobacteria bacterium]
MLALRKLFRSLFIFSQLLLMEGLGYAGPTSSSRIACVVESKEAEISITLENRSASKRKKILGRASAELKGGHFSNLKTEKNDVCVFSSVSREPGLEEAISIKYGEELSFLLKPNQELELTKLEIPQGDLKIIAPLSQFVLADGANLQAHSLMIRAQEIKNRAFLKTQELHIKGGDLENYGSIKSLKGNLSILMNDNVLLNREGGNIHSKSELFVFGVSTLTNKGIIKTSEKGMLHIEGAELYDRGTIYYADKNIMNIAIKVDEVDNNPIEKRKRNDSGFESDSDSGRSRTSSFSSVLNDFDFAEILDLLETSEFFQGFPQAAGEELAGEKGPFRFPRHPMSCTFEAQPSSREAGRSLAKTSHHFNVFRGPIKSVQHKVSSATARTPSFPELPGGSEKRGKSSGFEDKLTSLDSMSSLRDGASNNPVSKSFETPKEEKTALSKIDIFLVHVRAGLDTAGGKFSEMFFLKGVVCPFFIILWENFLTFKYWFFVGALCGLFFWRGRKMLLFFRDTLGADI